MARTTASPSTTHPKPTVPTRQSTQKAGTHVESRLINLFVPVMGHTRVRAVIGVDRVRFDRIGGNLVCPATKDSPIIQSTVKVSMYGAKQKSEINVEVHSIETRTQTTCSQPKALQPTIRFTATCGNSMVLFERLRELDAASTEAVTAASTPMLLKTMHVNRFRYRSKRVSFVFKVERVKEGRTRAQVASAAKKILRESGNRLQIDHPEPASKYPRLWSTSFKAKVVDILSMCGESGSLKLEDI